VCVRWQDLVQDFYNTQTRCVIGEQYYGLENFICRQPGNIRPNKKDFNQKSFYPV